MYPKTLVRQGNYRVKHLNYKHQKGYTSKMRGSPKLGLAVLYLYNKYSRSMNDISKILGISTRTAHRKICFDRLARGRIRDGSHRRRKGEVKIVNTKGVVIGLKRLVFRLSLYFLGQISSVQEALGDDPP